MDLSFTPEQELLADAVRRFLADRYPFEARGAILRSPEGWSRQVWAGLAELGLLGLQVPEAHGGMAPAAVETLVAMTAFGRALLLEPYLSSAVLATALVRELGSASQQAGWRGRKNNGETIGPASRAGYRLACLTTNDPSPSPRGPSRRGIRETGQGAQRLRDAPHLAFHRSWRSVSRSPAACCRGLLRLL